MKVIPVDLIESVTASNADAEYPITSIQNLHPQDIWKGTSTTATLTFVVTGGTSSALAIFNTNATSITATLSNPNEFEWDGITWDGLTMEEVNTTLTATSDLDGSTGSWMVQWQAVNAAIQVEVVLTNDNGETIQAGVALAGELYEYSGPSYGLKEGGFDESILTKLSNGAVDIKDGDAGRTFDLTCNIARDTSFHEFMSEVFLVVKSRPTVWLITDLSNSRWLVFARMQKTPIGNHSTYERTKLSLKLTEVV